MGGGACALAMALFAAVAPTSVQRLVFSDIDIWHLSRKRLTGHIALKQTAVTF